MIFQYLSNKLWTTNDIPISCRNGRLHIMLWRIFTSRKEYFPLLPASTSSPEMNDANVWDSFFSSLENDNNSFDTNVLYIRSTTPNFDICFVPNIVPFMFGANSHWKETNRSPSLVFALLLYYISFISYFVSWPTFSSTTNSIQCCIVATRSYCFEINIIINCICILFHFHFHYYHYHFAFHNSDLYLQCRFCTHTRFFFAFCFDS